MWPRRSLGRDRELRDRAEPTPASRRRARQVAPVVAAPHGGAIESEFDPGPARLFIVSFRLGTYVRRRDLMRRLFGFALCSAAVLLCVPAIAGAHAGGAGLR